MPSWLPEPQQLIDVSGAAEIIGGLGVLVPQTRRAAGWGLIALLITVFPVNVNMAVHAAQSPGRRPLEWLLWVRLPIQAVLVGWVSWAALAAKRGSGPE